MLVYLVAPLRFFRETHFGNRWSIYYTNANIHYCHKCYIGGEHTAFSYIIYTNAIRQFAVNMI